jgi:TetR/AcrR family transcriptional repressor of nem operon
MARPREFDMDEVLDAALAVFWERGYEATSMADLMEATGLHKGSLYKAFRDKHDLFVQALQRYLGKSYEQIRHMLLAAESPVQALTEFLHGLTDSCHQDSTRKGCFAVNCLVELANHDGAVSELTARHFTRIEKLLCDQIARGQKNGEIRDDIPAGHLAESFSVYLSGLLARAKAPNSSRKSRRLVDGYLKMLSLP